MKKIEAKEMKEIESKVYSQMKKNHGALYARLYMVWAKKDLEQKGDNNKVVLCLLDGTLNLWDHHLSA